MSSHFTPGTTRPISSHTAFRGIILLLAFVLVVQTFWILSAEFFRQPSLGFPADSESGAASANRDDAHLAALFGYLRGDLWAADLLTYPAAYQLHEKNNPNDQTTPRLDQLRYIAERSLSFAPHDARVWLALANIDSRFDWLNGKAAAYLRMSYYTGANEIDLIPLRLWLAVGFSDISDPSFGQLVRHDIAIIVTRKPELKQAILNAYASAPPDGKRFIETTLAELNSTLLSETPPK